MRQKLNQYSGLVDMAETQSGDRRTTADDLQVRVCMDKRDVLGFMSGSQEHVQRNDASVSTNSCIAVHTLQYTLCVHDLPWPLGLPVAPFSVGHS